jgi:predicted kinase
MNVIVLRGPAGAGKSTLAVAVQQALGYPTAHLDTDVLNWQFVPGESNKHVVFEVLQQITATYLAHGYHVVIAGTIPTMEEAGALAAISAAARSHRHGYREFFCDAPLSTCIDRASGRDRNVTPADIERWWHESRQDLATLTSDVTVLDMTLPLESNVESVCAFPTT